MMKEKKKWLGLAILSFCLVFFAFVQIAEATIAGELKGARIINHYFSTRIMGRAGNDTRTIQIKDSQKYRFLILSIEAITSTDSDSVRIFTHDFTLQYYREGKEDRARCIGVSKVNKDGFTENLFALGEESSIFFQLNGPEVRLALVFNIENDVDSIKLYRIGDINPIAYNISPSHSFSVYITSNSPDSLKVREIAKSVEASGCKVFWAMALAKDIEGMTIHYGPKVEPLAREICQRLMLQFRLAPKMSEMTQLFSSYDIVIWVGKGIFKEVNL